MASVITRTRLSGSAKARAISSRTPAVNWVEIQTVSPSVRQSATIAVRFQAAVHLHLGAVFALDDDLRRGEARRRRRRAPLRAGPRTLPASGSSATGGSPVTRLDGDQVGNTTGAFGARASSMSTTKGSGS